MGLLALPRACSPPHNLPYTAFTGAPHVLLGLKVTPWPGLALPPGKALVQGGDPGSWPGSGGFVPKEVVPIHSADLGTPRTSQPQPSGPRSSLHPNNCQRLGQASYRPRSKAAGQCGWELSGSFWGERRPGSWREPRPCLSGGGPAQARGRGCCLETVPRARLRSPRLSVFTTPHKESHFTCEQTEAGPHEVSRLRSS